MNSIIFGNLWREPAITSVSELQALVNSAAVWDFVGVNISKTCDNFGQGGPSWWRTFSSLDDSSDTLHPGCDKSRVLCSELPDTSRSKFSPCRYSPYAANASGRHIGALSVPLSSRSLNTICDDRRIPHTQVVSPRERQSCGSELRNLISSGLHASASMLKNQEFAGSTVSNLLPSTSFLNSSEDRIPWCSLQTNRHLQLCSRLAVARDRAVSASASSGILATPFKLV